MLVQAGLCRICSETTLLVFPRGGSIILYFSPFKVDVQPGSKADKVKVPAWDELPAECNHVKPCLASIPEQFVIDCREAGTEQPECLVQVGWKNMHYENTPMQYTDFLRFRN